MSDAPNIQDGPVRSAMHAGPTQVRWTCHKSLFVASFLVTTIVATAAWRAASAHLPAAGIERVVAAGTLGRASEARAESPAIAQARAASSVPFKSTAPTTFAAREVPAAITNDLAELKSAYQQLTLHAQETDQRLDRIESDVAQLKQRFEKQQAAFARASKLARNAPPHPRTAQAMVQAHASQAPRILGVDTWNGQPSVSVMVGTEVRFFSEGDVVADALVKRADPASQSVEFVTGSGATITTTSASGAER